MAQGKITGMKINIDQGDEDVFGSDIFPMDVIRDLLEELDIEDSEGNVEHVVVLLRALNVYAEREEKYRGGWRDRGWKGNIADVLRKNARIRSMFWSSSEYSPADHPDDIIDNINYSVFALRNAEAGNVTGDDPHNG